MLDSGWNSLYIAFLVVIGGYANRVAIETGEVKAGRWKYPAHSATSIDYSTPAQHTGGKHHGTVSQIFVQDWLCWSRLDRTNWYPFIYA